MPLIRHRDRRRQRDKAGEGRADQIITTPAFKPANGGDRQADGADIVFDAIKPVDGHTDPLAIPFEIKRRAGVGRVGLATTGQAVKTGLQIGRQNRQGRAHQIKLALQLSQSLRQSDLEVC